MGTENKLSKLTKQEINFLQRIKAGAEISCDPQLF
jgi:hypothetical protein